MERWEEIYRNRIPIGDYITMVKNGEEEGLVIELKGKKCIVNIEFGAVSAFRMLDEGIILDGVFDSNEISKYKNDKFSNVIYKIEGGEFGNYIKKASNELYEYLGLKHYVIITMNYVIEVICQWEPNIEILQTA